MNSLDHFFQFLTENPQGEVMQLSMCMCMYIHECISSSINHEGSRDKNGFNYFLLQQTEYTFSVMCCYFWYWQTCNWRKKILCFGQGNTVSNKFTKKFGTEREENQEKRLARAVGRQEQQWQGFKSFRGEFKKARTGTNLAAVERYKTRVRVKSYYFACL